MKNKNYLDELDKREKYIQAFSKFSHVLTTNQNQIFYLYYIEDLSLSEISDIVATTRSSVYDTLKKARNKLDKFLNIN